MQKKYKCPYIDSGINFFYNEVRVCCKSAHKVEGMPVLAEYDNISIKNILEKKKEYKKRFETGDIPAECEGCIFISETEKPNEDLSFGYIDINTFINCNCQCVYCSCKDIENFNEKSVYGILQELCNKKMIKNIPEGYMQFAGGEPTLMKDFEKIINLFIKNDIDNYLIHSSGIKYSKAIEKLLKEKSTRLVISPDAGSKEVYKCIKNVPAFERVISNIKKYAKAASKNPKSSVITKYIIIPGYNDSTEEIVKWYDLSLSLGIKSIILDVEMNWYKQNNHSITDSIKDMVMTIREKCVKDKIELDYYESLKDWFFKNPV